MMNSRLKLLKEIKKLNSHLDRLGNNSRFMVYSTSPGKYIFYNFVAGLFGALGSLFGTAVVAGLIVYLLSHLHLNFLNSLTQWTQAIPTIKP